MRRHPLRVLEQTEVLDICRDAGRAEHVAARVNVEACPSAGVTLIGVISTADSASAATAVTRRDDSSVWLARHRLI
jgi:hypothetical protein